MKPLIFMVLLVLFTSCQHSTKKSYSLQTKIKEEHLGKKLIETQCNICHSPTASYENRLAPPMIAIKKHYISDGTTKEEFTQEIQNWFINPTKDNAKMYGAVRKFGVMPKLLISEDNLKQISEYIYDNDIDQPEWFENHYMEEKRNNYPIKQGRGKQL